MLDKIDKNASPGHKLAVGKKWKEWHSDKEKNAIFFDFIDRERNNMLKEFSFGAELPSFQDGRLLAYKSTELDGVTLFSRAINWWKRQLNDIELLVGAEKDQGDV